MPGSKRPTRRVFSWDALRDPDTARLVRPISAGTLVRADRVQLSRGILTFEVSSSPRSVRVPEMMLEQFLGLDSDEAIVGFALKYGPLLIDPLSVRDAGSGGIEYREPIKEWQQFPGVFSRLLSGAAAVKSGQKPDLEMFQQMVADQDFMLERLHRNVPKEEPDPIDVWKGSNVKERRRHLAWTVEWLAHALVNHADLRLYLTGAERPGTEWVFDLAFRSSIGIPSGFRSLVLQLLAAIVGTGFAVCSSCGVSYVPKRRPRTTGRHYCVSCGRAAALRDAKADYRRRVRSANRGRKAGD
jgi:hypothetical protein